VWAGGAAEAAGAAAGGGRSQYLADQGIIVPPDEVHTDSYVAAVDYRYPYPDEGLGVYLFNGNRQLSAYGQEDILQIGIQASKIPFEELTPMNLAFVIDHSGSMASSHKLDWVKDAFDIFITKVRDTDYVSLVIFDDVAQVVFPATKMDSEEVRRRFKRTVHSIRPDGSTNIRGGLQLGCLEVLKNYNTEYTNRVMFLSDGCDTVGNSHDSILDVAGSFAEQGVTISTIGVGESFDLHLMVEMGKVGHGSSRFISNREEMEKIFGSELDRMVVAQAKNLEMTLEFLMDVDVIDTWGYRNSRRGRTVRYYQPTLHHGDYETILVHFRTNRQHFTGAADLARFTVKYEDNYGNAYVSGPHVLEVNIVKDRYPVAGISDGMVLRSGTMLHMAQNMKAIGSLYYSNKREANMEQALGLAVATKNELVNAKIRLDNTGFDDEIEILNQYITILGGELHLAEQRTRALVTNMRIAPPTPERSLLEHGENLCREIALDLAAKRSGVVAVCGFASKGEAVSGLISQLSDMAYREVSQVRTVSIVESATLSLAIGRKGFGLSDLTDKLNAVKVGAAVGADYILTGTVMGMGDTVIVFSRLLNVHNGEVESAAQIILPWA
jgi:Ca-activated chloride channel family protein